MIRQNISAIKEKFLQWEDKYWLTSYAYGLVSYLCMTGSLINFKILSSSLSIFYITYFRTFWIFLINGFTIEAESLQISQKNPQSTTHHIQPGIC